MRIVLSSLDPDLIQAWHEAFTGATGVEISPRDILTVGAQAIVSPANSFGFMDGGLDYHLSEHFGWHVQERVQAAIKSRPLRDLLVGEATVIATEHVVTRWLICAPTMRVPMVVRTSVNAYLAMKAALLAAHSHSVPIASVAIPGLATGIGKISPRNAARQMYAAYEEVLLGRNAFPESFADAQRQYIHLNADANLSEP